MVRHHQHDAHALHSSPVLPLDTYAAETLLHSLPSSWLDDDNNVLFKLHASDTKTECSHDGESSQRPVLYAQFALDACAIVAGSCSDGWLSPNRDPEQAATPELLRTAHYMREAVTFISIARIIQTDATNHTSSSLRSENGDSPTIAFQLIRSSFHRIQHL